MTMQVDIRQVIHAFSDALDLVGIDDVQHGKRVAFMAVECGKAMKFDPIQLDIIYHAALLHDCGVSSTQVHRNLVSELDWEGSQEHCLRGEALLSRCSLISGLAPIIRYHHTHWEDLPNGLDPEVARISNLIYLADRVDALTAQRGDTDLLSAKAGILKTIKKYRGLFFEAGLTDMFLKISAGELFWLMLEPRHLTRFILKMEKEARPRQVDHPTFLELAMIFADIVDAKSPFTVQHSLGVARLAKFLGELSGLSGEVCDKLEVAGLLHDLGKLNVPDEILEKPGPLTEAERMVMMRHSFESYQILVNITGFNEIAQWAAFHHEALSGMGYPFHKTENELCLEARIISVADVFQALVQKRPYRDSLPTEEVFATMQTKVAGGALDPDLVALVRTHAGQCRRRAECLD